MLAGRGGIGRFMRQQKKEEEKARKEGYEVSVNANLKHFFAGVQFWNIPGCLLRVRFNVAGGGEGGGYRVW